MFCSSGFLLSLAALVSSPTVAEIGRIKSSIGDATVQRGTTHIPAATGQDLLPGDWLETGRDGRISLTFIDNTRFAVGPDSRIGLSTFEYNPTTEKGSFVTQVERGSIAVVSGRISHSGRDAMQLRTDDEVLGISDAEVIVEVPR